MVISEEDLKCAYAKGWWDAMSVCREHGIPTAPATARIPSSASARPTVDQIKEYCIAKHFLVDYEKFFDYYESNGWKVGRLPMKDWKAAVRNWNRRSKEFSGGNGHVEDDGIPAQFKTKR